MTRHSFAPARFAASLLFLVLMAAFTAQACGPDFYPDVFVLKLRPDHPKEFAAGKLGVILPTYPRADLTVAFRYLNGGALTAAEQQAYQPIYAGDDSNNPYFGNTSDVEAPQTKEPPTPLEKWQTLHAKLSAPAPEIDQNRSEKIKQADGSTYESSFLNCGDNAFETASATLQSRAKIWGEKSSDLADWLKGQDAVFSNCAKGPLVLPATAPPNASALLKADRAYQQAAAEFYALQFGDARKTLEAIGQDTSSPWRGIARYLVARSLIRQAFYSAGGADYDGPAKFDAALMQQAQTLLQSLLGQNLPGISRQAIQNQLDLVRLRTEPNARLRELSDALIGPRPDPDYDRHLGDLTWYLDMQLDQKPVREDFGRYESPDNPTGNFSKTYSDLAQLRASSTLVDWLITFQSPATEAKDHAIAQWKSTHQPYWLLAAISKATEKDASAADLVTAAEQIKPDSAAWESFTYHRLRLLTALGRAQEARTLLDQTIPAIQKGGRDSSINAFIGLRMRSSANLNEFLTYAPRKVIAKVSEEQSSLGECVEVMKDPKRIYDCAKQVSPVQFSADAVGFFSTQAPLSTLITAAGSSTLPDQLRSSIAIMAWVRAVLLNDDASATKLFPLLPAKIREQAAPGIGFHAVITVLRNPGLRPYLDPGVQRSYSYDFVESFGDNWWCADWKPEVFGGKVPLKQAPASFLTTDEINKGATEVRQLTGEGSAAVYLGKLTIDYANTHPDDKDVPESLYLVLRMIRYGCDRGVNYDSTTEKSQTNPTDDIRKTAARILRQHYATNPWTKKAAPYAG